MKNNETVNLTCRLNKSVYDILSKEAEDNGISINSLINNMATRYISWDRYAKRIGFIPLSKRAISEIFDILDIDSIKKIARGVGSTIPKEMLYLTSNDESFENIVKFIEILAKRFGVEKVIHEDSKIVLTIHHGISKNFSEYIAEMHRAMSNSFSLAIKIDSIENNFLSMTIKKAK